MHLQTTDKELQDHVLVTFMDMTGFLKPSFPNCNLQVLGQKLLSCDHRPY